MGHARSMLKAASWMGGWLFLMLVLAIAGRETTREIGVIQVMAVRSLIGFLMLVPLIALTCGFGPMATARPRAHIMRGTVHYFGQLAWFYALTMIPLAQLVSIEFTMPIWIAVLAPLFLGEKLSTPKLVAIALGLIGVVVIVRPATGSIDPGQLIALASAVGFAISVVLTKSLTNTDSPLRIIWWMTIIQTVLGIGPAIYLWQWPSAYVWLWLVVIAFCGTFSHFCLARAMTHADATVVMPMDFLRVPLTALVGWLFYAEAIDLFTAFGAAFILLGNTLNLRGPAQQTKAAEA